MKAKTKFKPYPINLPPALYEAVKQVARDRGARLNRDVYMKDVIIMALTLDPEVARHYNRYKRREDK
jgi:hypothetical protein